MKQKDYSGIFPVKYDDDILGKKKHAIYSGYVSVHLYRGLE